MINIISAMTESKKLHTTDGYTCMSPCLNWGAVGKCMVLSLVSLFEFVWSNFTSSYVDSGLTTFLLAIATRKGKGKILKMLHGMPESWKGNGASGCNDIRTPSLLLNEIMAAATTTTTTASQKIKKS
jgi:hypothetical protein